MPNANLKRLQRRAATFPLVAFFLGAMAAVVASPARANDQGPTDPEKLKFFEEKVRPILVEHCVKCHGGEKTRGGLRMTTRDGLFLGGDTGPAVSLKPKEKSLLIEAVNYAADIEMPPKQKLPQAQIDVLTEWVKQGAPWTPGANIAPPKDKKAEAAEPQHAGPPKPEDARNFWAFVPATRPAMPAVKAGDWVRSPVDAFVLSKLESKGLAPAPPADKVALLRRAFYDLVGLPPSPADVDAFLADPSPDAYEKVIDRLLASPQYGEKWGRHWLDLVRYGESNSYERDNPKPNAWRFRDYVIRSFNDDKPYDRFVKEQLAGDEMPGAATNPDLLIATGFYRLGIWDDDPADKFQHKYEVLDDIVATTSNVFLGMTLDCARCHDHKIDPIPQTDYYALLAFFHNVTDYRNGGRGDERPIVTSAADADAFENRQKERRQKKELLEKELLDINSAFHQLILGDASRKGFDFGEAVKLIPKEGERVLGKERFLRWQELKKELRTLEKPFDGVDLALCVTESSSNPVDTFLWIRGNAGVQGAKVEPGFPKVLGAPTPVIPKAPPGAKTTGRRTVLADWLASDRNPLFARVMANRLWQYHFGRGIVRSSNNFGFGGDKPTHPELLDWLTTEFVKVGWRMKPMHRLIMTSSAYRMGSTPQPDVAARAATVDPGNDLLWRYDLRRLSAEEVRDSILALNGTLNPKMFGPSVYPVIPKEVLAGQSRPGENWKTSTPEEAARRSIYVHQKRSLRVPVLESFDGADPDKSCPVRFTTIQPTQALGGINSAFFNDEAQKLARRLKKEAGEDVRQQVALAFRLSTARAPSDAQVARGVGLIEDLKKKDGTTPDAALKYFCLMVLNLNEFVYVD